MTHAPRRRRLIALLATGAAVATVTVGLVSTNAGAHGRGGPARNADRAAATDTDTSPNVARRVAAARALAQRLGDRTAGTYLADDGTPVITVTDAAAAQQVEAIGARAKKVARSGTQLNAVFEAVALYRGTVGTMWTIDPANNQVVVTVASESANAPRVQRLLSSVEKYGDAVQVRRVDGQFHTNISGGTAIFTGQARCSLGFNVQNQEGQNFFLTAGHCTEAGDTWTDQAGQEIGQNVFSSFPGDDFGVVQYTGDVPADGTVGRRDITAAADPVVGQRVCRRGSTTGTHCGTVLGLNATVNYAEGTVTGLIDTTVCAEPGDSGGPLFSGNTAHGLTSGGSGDCTTGGETFFQPVSEPLARFGLSVI